MKKFMCFLLSGMLFFSSVLCLGVPEVKAEEKSVTVTPTQVKNIKNDATKLVAAFPSTDEQNYKYIFKFVLKEASEVRITSLSRYAFWNWNGDTKLTLTDSVNEFSSSFNESWETKVNADHPWADQAGNYADKFLVLQKGTYYLTVTTTLADTFRTDEYSGHKITDFELGFWLSLNAAVYTYPVTIKSCKNISGKKLKVKYRKVTADGYDIQYSISSKFKKKKTASSTSGSATIRSLKKKKTYYVRVRAYRMYDGKKMYGQWSAVKKVKIKK